MAADFVLRIIRALLTDFDTVCVGFATPIVSGHQQLISSLLPNFVNDWTTPD